MDDQVFVSASIGIALASGPKVDADDLLRKADIALYEAKKNGRGRYQVFAGDMDDLLLRKRKVENALRRALRGGTGIKLAYQPIFAADGRTIVGAEALIRWAHEIHGALPPQQFIAIAEERGMIGELGQWVLLEACRFAVDTQLPWVAVNVSPLQLRDAGFAGQVASILAETGLPPARLQLEITESVLLENNDTTRTALEALRRSGVGVVLDDFGTGYSSLNYLRRHLIDKLKIDRSFVRLLDEDSSSAAIVKALIDLAIALDVEVTAEGVETEEQKALLVGMGCHQLQGYLLAPPIEPAQLLLLPGLSPIQSGQRRCARNSVLPARQDLVRLGPLHLGEGECREVERSRLLAERHRDVVQAFRDVAGKRIDDLRPRGLAAHDADAAVGQGAEAVGLAQHPHAGPERAFRQHRDRQARKHGGGDDGRRETGEQDAIVAVLLVQHIDGGAPPDAVRPAKGHRQRLLFMRRMVGRADPQQRLAPHHFRLAAHIVVRHQRQVEIAALDVLDQPRRRLADDGQFDARVGAREARHDLGQEAVGIVVRRADADGAFEPLVVEGGERFAVEVEQPPCVGEQLVAFLRQPVAAPLLLEQRLADPLLQPAHLHRHRRLGAVHLFGCPREAAGIGNRDEGLQLIEIERRFHRYNPSLMLMLRIRNIRWINQSADGKLPTST